METEAEALNGEATDSRRMEVQIGGAVTLECDGGCWGHGPGMDPVGGPGPLALSRVVYQEAGEYRCVAPDRKMQDTWRAQLPYHIKITGESDKIFTEVECHWLVDVSPPYFLSLVDAARVYRVPVFVRNNFSVRGCELNGRNYPRLD